MRIRRSVPVAALSLGAALAVVGVTQGWLADTGSGTASAVAIGDAAYVRTPSATTRTAGSPAASSQATATTAGRTVTATPTGSSASASSGKKPAIKKRAHYGHHGRPSVARRPSWSTSWPTAWPTSRPTVPSSSTTPSSTAPSSTVTTTSTSTHTSAPTTTSHPAPTTARPTSTAPTSTTPTSTASTSTTTVSTTATRTTTTRTSTSPATTTASTTAPNTGSGIGTFAAEVVRLTNQERTANGCSALTVDAKLTAAAQGHSADMAAQNYFSHTGLDGSSMSSRITAQGYAWSMIGENIAAGQQTPSAVVTAWMNSAGHRANILNCSFTQLGVGVATGGRYGIYWTQDFGTPR